MAKVSIQTTKFETVFSLLVPAIRPCEMNLDQDVHQTSTNML